MNIYNIKIGSIHETDKLSLNIYLSGCKGYCQGCHSDHTWDFTAGSLLDVEELINYIKTVPDFKYDNICILGGEPLDQPTVEVVELLQILRKECNKPLWLYTHFEIEEVPSSILQELDYIKTGEFLVDTKESKEQYGVFLASYNQVIHKLR